MAWIALDEGDDDPGTLLALLVSAADMLRPGSVQNAAAVLAGAPDTDVRRVIGIFINDLLSAHAQDGTEDTNSQVMVLVLDDVHLLENAACITALDYLLEHLPPMLHLVGLARHDPPLALARLRARGQLAEFRMDQLRFSTAETANLLRETIHMALSQDDLTALYERTEGWVTALRLLSLSLTQMAAGEQSVFLRDLLPSRQFIFDYLADEVLQRERGIMRDFLLATSVLDDMTPALCQAVTGLADAGARLDDLYRRNLFVTRSGVEPDVTYRYHALWRQFLQVELRRHQPGEWERLQRRAADTHGVTLAALPHLAAIEAWDDLADVLNAVARTQLNAGYIQPNFRQWLLRVPEEGLRGRPWLELAMGRLRVQQGLLMEGQPYLERALEDFRRSGEREGEIQTLLYRSQRTVGNDPVYLKEAEETLASYTGNVPPWLWISYLMTSFWSVAYAFDWDASTATLVEMVNRAEEFDDPDGYQALAQMMTPPILYSHAGLAPLDRLAAQLAKHASGNPIIELGYLMLAAMLAFVRGELDAAVQIATKAAASQANFDHLSWVGITPFFVMQGVYRARDAQRELEQHCRQAEATLMHISTMAARHNDILAARAWLRWRQGRADDLAQTIHAMEQCNHFRDHQANTLIAQAMGAMTAHNWHLAQDLLHRAAAIQAETRNIAFCDARLLAAQIHWQQGEEALMLRELGIALADWERRDMPGIVLMEGPAMIPLLQAATAQGVHTDFAQRCLTCLGVDAPPRPVLVPDTGATLTPREVAVLRLIVQGKRNPAIADELIITERTVKSHVTNILAKLDVKSRTEAATRARDLGIL